MACVNGNDFHDGTGDDFGCQIKHVQFCGVTPAAAGGKLNGVPRKPLNSWERGRVKDGRGMPLMVNRNGTLIDIPVKDYANNRSKYEEARKLNAYRTQPKES